MVECSHDSKTADVASQLIVLTVNLCIMVPGITNRHLPKWIQVGSFLFVAPMLTYAWRAGYSVWACLVVVPLALFVTTWLLGVLLARIIGVPLLLLGFDDCKCERVDLFLQALREKPEWKSVDVICIQECYSCLFFPGNCPERLSEGAAALGFKYWALPPQCPSWPATLGQNSGLLILSKKPIRCSASLTFGLSLEAGNVNRGALYAGLQDGTHIFTCHVAPSVKVAGDNAFARLVGPLVNAARTSQVSELASFILRHSSIGEPVVVAGDFNMDICFSTFESTPVASDYAASVVDTMRGRCSLVEATSQVRAGPQCMVERSLQFCRPTFGYTGCGDGGPAERKLTSYGSGQSVNTCDDAVFFRGFVGVKIAEESLLIPDEARPRPDITHLSDHWAIRVVLNCLPRSHTETVHAPDLNSGIGLAHRGTQRGV